MALSKFKQPFTSNIEIFIGKFNDSEYPYYYHFNDWLGVFGIDRGFNGNYKKEFVKLLDSAVTLYRNCDDDTELRKFYEIHLRELSAEEKKLKKRLTEKKRYEANLKRVAAKQARVAEEQARIAEEKARVAEEEALLMENYYTNKNGYRGKPTYAEVVCKRPFTYANAAEAHPSFYKNGIF